MIRNLIISIFCFFSVTVFANSNVTSAIQAQGPMCNEHASISTAPDFCTTFPPAANCNCQERTKDPYYCNSMTNIYCSMLKTYTTLEEACQRQSVTSQQECIADWKCYWEGGTSKNPPDANHTQCNATGIACTTVPEPTLKTCP